MTNTPSAVLRPFASRVQTLRASWIERRELQSVANAHEFESQLRLLQTLHRWATECTADVAAVYEAREIAAVSPAPTESLPAFTVTIAGCQTATFSLAEHRTMGGAAWFVEARMDAVPGATTPIAVAPGRRDGQWSRARLEDLILSAIGAFERLRHDGEPTVALRQPSSTIADFA